MDCRKVPWVQRPGISIRGKIVLLRNPGYKTGYMRLNEAYPGSLPEVKYQVRNLVRVVGITDPLPHGQSAQYSGKIRFIELQGVNGHTTPMPAPPQQWYDAGESGKVQGRDIVGIEEGSCGYRSRVVSIRGTFDISRNPGYKTGGCPVAKRSSDPQRETEGELWVLLPHLPDWVSVFGENSFYRAPGSKWAQETCAGCTPQRNVKGKPGKVQGGSYG